MTTFLHAISQVIAFEDAEAEAAAAKAIADEKAAAAVAAKTIADEKAAAAKAADNEKRFTQEQVNTFVAEERRKTQERQRKMVVELEGLQKSASLTAKEKEALEKRIEDLQTQYMTAEEKARRAEDEAEKTRSEEITTLTEERDGWRTRHAALVVNTAIIDAAAANKALFYEQIIALLGPTTRLVEKLDDEGKPTGDYEPKVSFSDKDKDNKPLILELTVPEAVKRMGELEKYGNLFEGGKKGGLGGSGSATSGGKIDIAKIAREDPKAYRKLRKEKPELFGK